LSEVIQLGEGYHIIQVLEREAARPLATEMQIELKRAVFEEWLTDLRAGAEIERLVAE
jgi:parvulin-like peptidyl-prolyl isomerase